VSVRGDDQKVRIRRIDYCHGWSLIFARHRLGLREVGPNAPIAVVEEEAGEPAVEDNRVQVLGRPPGLRLLLGVKPDRGGRANLREFAMDYEERIGCILAREKFPRAADKRVAIDRPFDMSGVVFRLSARVYDNHPRESGMAGVREAAKLEWRDPFKRFRWVHVAREAAMVDNARLIHQFR
jgi:hypothetical protein